MQPRVIGIDVGGPKKGFHAVVLCDSQIVARTRTNDPVALARWCVEQKADVVAVDAPCRWRGPKLARSAERELAAEGIACYYAPTEKRAREHAFYQWMLPGADLYAALSPHFTLYTGSPSKGPVVMETFPQAVACALAGQIVSAKEKRTVRQNLIQSSGIPMHGDETMDDIDALLCAVAGTAFAHGKFKTYGDAADGFIVVPRDPLIPPEVLIAPKAQEILPYLRAELVRLDTIPDVIAVGHLKMAYHLTAHYGLHELRDELMAASTRLFHRYDLTDPVKLHHYIATSVHCLCDPEWMPVLEKAVKDLGLPWLTRSFLKGLKTNVQAYEANLKKSAG
jgi:predicted nuclease with RNAse H fold